MRDPKIDFLSEEGKIYKKPKRKIGFVVKFFIYLFTAFIILIVASIIQIVPSGENFAKSLDNVGLWSQIKHLVSSEEKPLLGQGEDGVNILLMGIGGKKHEGPYLTDTMMVVSFKPSTNQVALISLPRDLYVEIPGYGWQKINHANAYGEINGQGEGGKLATRVVSQILDLPIHYYARIDFAGFVKIIDELGGIKVEVENTLDDFYYPIEDKENATTSAERLEHLHIEKGIQYMDGKLALKYARSRQAIGIEGSDFARAKRQQKILLAIKDKLLSFSTLFNPLKISGILNTLSAHLLTNLEAWEIVQLYKLGKNINQDDIIHRVFDDSPDGPLYSSYNDTGSYVLLTKSGDFSELSEIAGDIFETKIIAKRRTSKIEIKNGTTVSGLALQTSKLLQSFGYQIIKIGNAPTRDYQKTVIYNLKTENPTTTQETLQKILGAEIAPVNPDWATNTTQVSPQADFLIILGQDFVENNNPNSNN